MTKIVATLVSAFLLVAGIAHVNTGKSEPIKSGFKRTEFVSENDGRDFSWISISPNGLEWLITENVIVSGVTKSKVLLFNLDTKSLKQYELPDGYLYSYARFSPSGSHILITRIVNFKTQNEISKVREESEIVIMKADGTDLQVLPLSKGLKLAPFMSNDEKKVAFWRSKRFIPNNERMPNTDFDIWEFDLMNKKETLFSCSCSFVDGGNAQYLTEKNILVGAYIPSKYLFSVNDYFKKNNNSQVYMLSKAVKEVPVPIFTDIPDTNNPTVDRNGNIFLLGTSLTLGSSIVKISESGRRDYWALDKNVASSGIRQMLVAPSGDYVAFIYATRGTKLFSNKNSFAIFNLKNLSWTRIDIPKIIYD